MAQPDVGDGFVPCLRGLRERALSQLCSIAAESVPVSDHIWSVFMSLLTMVETTFVAGLTSVMVG